MVNIPVAYDVTRLFLGPLSRTPRGIDRVDFALAARIFRRSSQPCVGIIPTPWGTRSYGRDAVRRGLRRLERLWAERHNANDASVWNRLVSELAAGRQTLGADRGPSCLSITQKAQRMASLLSAAGAFLGDSASEAVPDGAVYLNVGHLSLALPIGLRWLGRRPDVAPVFMLHDVIPLDAPHLVSASSARHHAAMVRSTARHAAGLIVTTDDARRTVGDALARCGRRDIMTLSQPLPLSRSFNKAEAADPALGGTSYFVVCGAIEPRKNHALLFEVWRRLVRACGEEAPHLVVVGSPGWKSDEILAPWRSDLALRRRIHIVSGLGTPSLKRLMAGAVGLLMPSHAEGFGLPLIEAARLGVPVMASDIAAHREVAGAQALLLDPGKVDLWHSAVLSWTQGARPKVTPRPARSVIDERETYFRSIETFIEVCAHERRVARRMAAPTVGARFGIPAPAEPIRP